VVGGSTKYIPTMGRVKRSWKNVCFIIEVVSKDGEYIPARTFSAEKYVCLKYRLGPKKA
jgi:hypothetical protein